MLETLLALMTTKSLDVQVWHCDPLLVVVGGDEVTYGTKTQVEFTPFDSETLIGHAIATENGPNRIPPEIAIISRQYIDAPFGSPAFDRRQGLILMGTDQNQEPVTWFINGAADRFLTTPDEDVEYDEETAKILEEELAGEPVKMNLNSRF